MERMLHLHKELAAATIPADKKLYQRQHLVAADVISRYWRTLDRADVIPDSHD